MSPASAAQRAIEVAEAFERIHREQMTGLPLLNVELRVESIGFREFQDRMLGMVITPWMMSLILFPGPGDAWDGRALGDKESFALPGGDYRFMFNRIDGLGPLMMYSVHSPMWVFPNQPSAVAEATGFLERAMAPAAADKVEDPVNEELLGRILRGEKVPEVDAVVDGLPERVAGSDSPSAA